MLSSGAADAAETIHLKRLLALPRRQESSQDIRRGQWPEGSVKRT